MTPLLACLFLPQRPAAPKPLSPESAIARERERYRLDPKRVYYATPAARQADEDRVDALWASLLELKGKVGASKENLLQTLVQSDEMRALQYRMEIADRMAGYLDTREARAADAAEQGDENAEVAEDFVDDELAGIDPKAFESFAAAEPRLAPYRFRLEVARRTKAHRLSPHDEGLLARLNPYTARWQGAIFESLRQEKPTAARNEALAVALLQLAGFQTSAARLRGFTDAVDESLFPLDLRRPQVDALLDALAGQTGVEYEMNLATGSVPTTMQPPALFSVAQTTALVRAALSPLGPEYGRELATLFDPRNGRIDAAGGAHRSGTGMSMGFAASTTSVLYWPEYTGSYEDLDGFAHESGHAVHMSLMHDHGVLPCYSEGPGYFFESFGEFNQLLMADYLTRRETSPPRKLFYLLQFMNKAAYPIQAAFYPGLEYSIYDGVAKGTVVRTAQLDALETKALNRYVAGTPLNVQTPYWSTNETYYTYPLYVINHVLGALLADAYFVQYKKDPKGFVPRYLALMRNGFDGSPNDLLRRFLGFDLDDPKLVAGSAALVRTRMPELRATARAAALPRAK